MFNKYKRSVKGLSCLNDMYHNCKRKYKNKETTLRRLYFTESCILKFNGHYVITQTSVFEIIMDNALNWINIVICFLIKKSVELN